MELVSCPLCGAEITTRQREDLKKKHEAEIHRRLEAELEDGRRQIERERAAAQEQRVQFEQRLAAANAEIEETVRRKLAEREREVAERAVEEMRVKLQATELRVKQAEQREVTILAREQELAGRERLLEAQVKRQVSEQVAKEREQMAKDAEQVRADAARQMTARLQASERRLQEYEQRDEAMAQREAELAQQQRALSLEVSKRVAEQTQRIWDDASKSASETMRLDLQERDRVIAALKKDLDDAQRKASLGSAQLRGDIEEEQLEASLKRLFPLDHVSPVARGKTGADVVQIVRDQFGRSCGSILWECKQTKTWSDGWLPKLREDQRGEQADLAVLVTHALPADVEHFSVRDGILVTRRELIAGVAELLRSSLIRIAQAQAVAEQKEQKSERLFGYVTSKEFHQKIHGVVDAHVQMQALLEYERRTLETIWAKRAKLESILIRHVAHLYGDMSVLVGALPPVEGLEVSLDGSSLALEGEAREPEPIVVAKVSVPSTLFPGIEASSDGDTDGPRDGAVRQRAAR